MTMSTLAAAKTETPAAGRPTFTWSKTGRQYRDERGRAVSRTKVRGAMDAYVDSITATIRRDTEALVAGSMTIDDWHGRMEINLKEAHTASGAIAAGGWKQAKSADWALVGRRLKFRYKKLRQFARELEGGLPLDGSVVARAEMYGRGATGTYEAVLRQGDIAAGLDIERRIVHSGRPCDRCVSHAGRGWQPAGVLPDIGSDCDCLDNCQCTFERERSKPAPTPKPKPAPKPKPPPKPVPVVKPVIIPTPKPKPKPAPPPAPVPVPVPAPKPAPPPVASDPKARIATARARQRAENEEARKADPAYAKIGRKFPDLIPPGKITDRIAKYHVGEAKVETLVDLGRRGEEQSAALKAERDAHNRSILALMDEQQKIVRPYVDARKPAPAAVAARARELQTRIDEATRGRNEAKARMDAIASTVRDEAHRLLAVSDRATFYGDPAGEALKRENDLDPVAPPLKGRVDEALAWLHGHVARGDRSTVQLRLGQKPGQRAYHADASDHIALSPDTEIDVIVHEYGHAISAQFQSGVVLGDTVNERDQEFLKHRVGAEPMMNMREKFGERYDKGEFGRSDKFGAAFDERESQAYYVGKDYGGRSSEILAMGIQKLYNDPVGFARKDPEFARYVCGILDGSLR